MLEPVNDEHHARRIVHPEASFLAQLIAFAEKLPQFSDKRRAVPQDADAAYREAIERFSA